MMPRMCTNFGRRRTVIPRFDLVDRSNCPSLLNLTGLTSDPDLSHYIRAQLRQVKSDFRDASIFPVSEYQDCSCTSAGTSHWRLAEKIKANAAGWQDELAQSLLPYVLSHLSASIVNNVHEALAVDQSLSWRDYSPCDVRQNRSNPSFVLYAAGRAIQARIMLKSAALHQCVIAGSFLNVIKRHWLGCEWFREGHNGSFPEHRYLRHELFQEALNTYLEQPTQETLELSMHTLRWSLADLSCPISGEHPGFHRIQKGPAAEHLREDKAPESPDGPERLAGNELKAICDAPECETEVSASET